MISFSVVKEIKVFTNLNTAFGVWFFVTFLWWLRNKILHANRSIFDTNRYFHSFFLFRSGMFVYVIVVIVVGVMMCNPAYIQIAWYKLIWYFKWFRCTWWGCNHFIVWVPSIPWVFASVNIVTDHILWYCCCGPSLQRIDAVNIEFRHSIK